MNQPLIFSNQDIHDILLVSECMGVIENLFKNLDKCQMPPKIYLDIPNGDFRAMPAVVGNTAGIKWCGVHLNNSKTRRKCNIFAKVLINDVESGELLAIMDGESITAIRTAAVTGVATKYMANKDSNVAAFIGCGNQTKYQIDAIRSAMDLHTINLFDLDKSRAEDLKVAIGLTNLLETDGLSNIKVCKDVEECVRSADIITTLTPSTSGFLKYEWLKPAVHINAIGADAEGKRELEGSVLDNVNFLVYDNWEQCSHSGEIQYVPCENRKQPWASIGDVISGDVSIQGTQTVFDATGLAIEDVAVARYIHDKKKSINQLFD